MEDDGHTDPIVACPSAAATTIRSRMGLDASPSSSSSVVTLMKAAGRWAHARTPVPKLLATAGVPLRLWTDTFDQVARIQALACRLEKASSYWKSARLVVQLFQVTFPILLLLYVVVLSTGPGDQTVALKLGAVVAILLYFIFPIYAYKKTQENEDMMEEIPLAWQSLAEERKPYFEEFGIRVRAYQGPSPLDGGEPKLTLGGLQFVIIHNSSSSGMRAPPLATAYLAEAVARGVTIEVAPDTANDDEEDGCEMIPLVGLQSVP